MAKRWRTLMGNGNGVDVRRALCERLVQRLMLAQTLALSRMRPHFACFSGLSSWYRGRAWARPYARAMSTFEMSVSSAKGGGTRTSVAPGGEWHLLAPLA
jgi:hypothetical protein